MRNNHKKVAQHLQSVRTLSAHIEANHLGTLDSREWKQQWAERWVVFADLVAFAARAMRSDVVVLNNIVRFDRACQIVAAGFPTVRVRRFSDATFAIAGTFSEALGFAVALAHTCLAFNHEYLRHGKKPFFIHLIVPRITMARGQVLLLPEDAGQEALYAGIDPKNVLAGSAIVRAYYLERSSAGGLITVDQTGIEALKQVSVRGHRGRVANGLHRWIGKLSDSEALNAGEVYGYRRSVLDIPWLLLQPIQNETGRLWSALPADADYAIAAYLEVWDKSIREFYTPQNFDGPLEVVKHCQAAIRHAVQSYHLSNGRTKPKYQSAAEITSALAIKKPT